MTRLALLTLTVPLLALPTAAHAGGGGCFETGPAAEVATTTVVVDHACFGPVAAAVPVGATVTWVNKSGIPHNLSGPAVELTDLAIDGRTTVTFDKAGIYPYACMLHPGMSGVVVARDGVAPSTTPVAAARPDGAATSPAGWALGGLAVAGAAALVLRRVATGSRG